ncbi:MAG: T9SS type A sorting domain-containing protein [Saprospirales bacterium]|nr:T9SS type A sorting domain-containing protein [Saprospirales bacterium]
MSKSLLFTGLIGLFFTSFLPAQSLTGSFEHEGYLRDYRIYIPAAYDGTQPWPLVFNLHGYTSNAIEQEFYSQMDMVADTGHFLVCYPNGILNSWNVGLPGASTADDVSFINALIDTLSAHYLVDPARVFTCGMSNGGFMSYMLACQLTDRFAAIASVTGSMVPTQAALCSPSHPIPVLEIHGTADPVVPYDGLVNTLSIPDLLLFWTQKNGCIGDPSVEPVPNTVLLDGSTAELIKYNDCEAGTEVWHYKVYNGGHTWPGAVVIVGVTNQDFSASSAIWEFFLRHSPEGPSAGTEVNANEKEVLAFPNPFSETLTVRLPEGQPTVVSVWDQWGRLRWSGEAAEVVSLDTHNWQSGVYCMSVRSQDGVLRTKMLLRQK